MRKLLLVALIVGVCTPAIMAQETAKAGIYGGLQNLPLNVYGTNKQDDKQEPAKAPIYGGLLNLRLNIPETGDQDGNSLPQEPKPTFFSAVSHEMAEQYAINPPLNSRGASGSAGSPVQCPPTCAGIDLNKFEIYVGYSLLSHDFLFAGIFSQTPFDPNTRFDNFTFKRRRRTNLSGGEVSLTYYFSRYLGAQFDFSDHNRTPDFDVAFPILNNPVFGNTLFVLNGARTEFTVRNYLGGIQVKDSAKDGPRARPFGYLLLGASTTEATLRDGSILTDIDRNGVLEVFPITDRFSRDKTSFALALGAGIDIRLTKHFSLRPLKFDYLPVFSRPPLIFITPITPTPPPPANRFNFVFVDSDRIDRKTQNNYRVGAGIVFNF